MTGLERLIANPRPLGRAALYTNHTGVTNDFTPAAVAIQKAGMKLEKLFAPEHGIDGSGKEGEAPEVMLDSASGLPVVTLYDKSPEQVVEALEGLTCVLFDIQSVGTRFYTYLTSLKRLLEACQATGVKLMMLDRPNPNGNRIEGAMLESQYASFVGIPDVPLRFGLTYGEMAKHLSNNWDGLEVIPCDLEDTLPWVAPSPNIPSLETVAIYPGMCLVEGTDWSEGRGTTLPFQVFGAPNVDAHKLVSRLNSLGLQGVRFRPTFFTPNYQKHNGLLCAGAQVHVTELLEDVLPIGLSIVIVAKEFGANYRLEWLQKLLGVGLLESDLTLENIPNLIRAWNEKTSRVWLENLSLLYPRDFVLSGQA
ncbi:MAG: hypothetical protein RLZZ156_664 [Deinococcota bacterium]|jgi:uncharacterized protein YbbC (DUF1343 family)